MEMEYRGDKDPFRRQLARLPPRRGYMDLCVRVVVVLSLMGILFTPRPERRRAYMPQIKVLDESPDPCVAVSPAKHCQRPKHGYRIWLNFNFLTLLFSICRL